MSLHLEKIVELANEFPSQFLAYLTQIKQTQEYKLPRMRGARPLLERYVSLLPDLYMSAVAPDSDLKDVRSIPLLNELKSCLCDPGSYEISSVAEVPKMCRLFLHYWFEDYPELGEKLEAVLSQLQDIQAQDGNTSTSPMTVSTPEVTASAAGWQSSDEENNTVVRYPILPRKPRETYDPYTRRPFLPANQDTSKIYSSR